MQIYEIEDDWCDKQYDHDIDACYDKHRQAIISNLGACIQRAGEILAACKAGDSEPAPWNEQDEDVPLPGERGPFEFKIPPVVPFLNPRPPGGGTVPPKIHHLPQLVYSP